MIRKTDTEPDTHLAMNARGRSITLTMNLGGAEWLATELPARDGFTRDLWHVIEELREALT